MWLGKFAFSFLSYNSTPRKMTLQLSSLGFLFPSLLGTKLIFYQCIEMIIELNIIYKSLPLSFNSKSLTDWARFGTSKVGSKSQVILK